MADAAGVVDFEKNSYRKKLLHRKVVYEQTSCGPIIASAPLCDEVSKSDLAKSFIFQLSIYKLIRTNLEPKNTIPELSNISPIIKFAVCAYFL